MATRSERTLAMALAQDALKQTLNPDQALSDQKEQLQKSLESLHALCRILCPTVNTQGWPQSGVQDRTVRIPTADLIASGLLGDVNERIDREALENRTNTLTIEYNPNLPDQFGLTQKYYQEHGFTAVTKRELPSFARASYGLIGLSVEERFILRRTKDAVFEVGMYSKDQFDEDGLPVFIPGKTLKRVTPDLQAFGYSWGLTGDGQMAEAPANQGSDLTTGTESFGHDWQIAAHGRPETISDLKPADLNAALFILSRSIAPIDRRLYLA